MGIQHAVPLLAAGAFFGDRCCVIATPSFQFTELRATVPEHQVPRHTHEAAHFIVITAGVYITEARNQSGACQTGTFIFNPAGTTHRDRFRSPTGKFLSISVGTQAARLLEPAPVVPLIIAGRGVQRLDDPFVGDRIVRELNRGSTVSPIVLEGLGLELIGSLCRVEVHGASRFVPGWLRTAREVIEDSFDRELTIAELATCVGVHPVYLARAYRRHFGCSPGEYLKRCRLMRVRGLLLNTNLRLVEVALQGGFSDQSQMTRCFRQTFGMSPGRFRRMCRA